ncbi:MAG: cytochrome c [Elusimicrobia bacterium]|nr:cytochrome c [Elusimicrobiota bacterium]
MKSILFMALISGAYAADPAPAAKGPDAVKLYAAKCAGCHGKDAKGSKMFKLDLVASAAGKSETDLSKAIAEGKNKMPAFKGKLKDAEIGALASYVRSLSPVPAPKAQ